MKIEPTAKAKIKGARCKKCPLYKSVAVVPPPRYNAKLILLGEGPGEIEEEKGDFFVGPTGNFLMRTLGRFGVSWGSVHRNNATLCKPPREKKLSDDEWKRALECCSGRLEADIQKVKGALAVLTVGKKAMQSASGRRNLLDWAGAPLKGIGVFEGLPVVSTWHPAFALRKGKRAYLPVITIHAQRAASMARGKFKEWKWPPRVILPGKRMIRALQKLTTAKRIAVDVETYGEDPKAALLALGLGTHKLAVSMPWDEYTAGKHGGVDEIAMQPDGVEIAKLTRQILANPRIEKVMQNGQHDVLTLRAHDIEVNGFTFDTLFAHAVSAPQLPHKLGFIAGIETHAPAWKAEYGSSSDLKGAAKFARQNPLRLRTYNASDVVMTAALARIAEQRLEQTHNGRTFMSWYMALGDIASQMRERGVAVSDERRLVHREALRTRLYGARSDLRKLALEAGVDNFNPNSNPQLKLLFFKKLRVRPTRWSKETGDPSLDEEALAELRLDHRPLVAVLARRLLDYRLWMNRLGKYVVKLPIDRDGAYPVVHPVWKVHGALTGRWSCVSGDTKLVTSRGTVLAREYTPQPGDCVPTHTGAWRRVIRKFDQGVADVFRVCLANGAELKCTKTHRLLTPSGWKAVGALRAGEEVYSYDGFQESWAQSFARKAVQIREIAWVGPMDVFDLEVEEDHSYAAHGVFSHNCDKPNLHNIPQPVIERLKSGGKRVKYPGLRDMFVARPGNVIVKADYSQQELRIAALLAGAKKLLAWYEEGKDVHTLHAQMLFGHGSTDFVPSKNERTRIKNFVFNAIYGGGADTIYALLKADIPDLLFKDVLGMMRWLFETHPEIPAWHESALKQAKIDDYVEGPFTGRRRHFYKQVEPTELYNFPVQETAAYMKNRAVMKLSAALDADEYLLIDCHDELVCEGPDADSLAAKMKECMETNLNYKGAEMDFPVEIAIGDSWGTAEEQKK